jgi:transposase
VLRLSDDQWERIREHFPEENIPEGRPGRKPVPTREVLEGVLWILNTGAQWHMLPQCYPNYKTVPSSALAHRSCSGGQRRRCSRSPLATPERGRESSAVLYILIESLSLLSNSALHTLEFWEGHAHRGLRVR